MKITALRSIGKINRDVLQNSRRFFSFKFEMTPANRISEPQEEPKSPVPEEQQLPKNPNFRYNVCQPRTSPVERPTNAGDVVASQKQTVKAAIEEQHLQPSMLPEYFQKQMEKNVLINPEPEPNEEDRINKGHNPNNQRRFQVSKTYANAILPLKSVKLANPFPEPVKMMMSRTVSDDEKAEQMLAESRSQRNISEWGNKPTSSTFRTFSTEVKRWYSSKSVSSSDKCKKFTKKKTQGCPKMRLPHCPPQVRTRCDRIAKHIDCKKQEAPYPAYSEFCHEDIEEKPSECKICPWKPEENPNFKPQKKKLHTSIYPRAMRRSGLEMDWHQYSNEEVAPAEAEELPEGMQCDLRKPACERPKNRRCPPTKEEKKKQVEEKKKKEKPKSECISEILDGKILPAESARNLVSLRGAKKEKDTGHGHCKIKKFKFPNCKEPVRKQEQTNVEGVCPPKKKRPKIRDCPPDEESKCINVDQIVEQYDLSSDKGRPEKDKKCPKIDMTVLKEEVEDDDPCGLKRRGTTKVCPSDLLKKKRRKPRKKTSAIITPVDSKKEPPQPTRTI